MTAQAVESELAAVIGLEVHVQLETETKIFCGCSTEPADEPNTTVCPVCLGLPGALPVANEAAVEAAVRVGKAVDASIPEETRFHRKNYFYPDLPKGFQITQYDAPICSDGRLEIEVEGGRRTVGIQRAHLEEDPGSLQHVGGSIDTADYTLVDYNRAGTPLLEVVTAPDLRSPKEVRAFLAKLEEVLEYLGVFDASRDGSLRVDANISLVPEEAMGPEGAVDEATLADANRTEVKNISSHRGAEKALAYEITRQKNAMEHGRAVEQETRHWDEDKGITLSMRAKEAEADYRYFREADLPPLQVADWKERLSIPELPDARRERFREEYGLDEETASKLTSTKQVADFYEAVATDFDPDLAATWVADDLLGELNYRDMAVPDVEDRLDEFRRLIELVDAGEITEKNAREVVLREMLDEGTPPVQIVERENLGKSNRSIIEGAAENAMMDYLNTVDDYFEGKDEALNYLVGQVMQKTKGSADPQEVNSFFSDRLERGEPTDWDNLSFKRKEALALIFYFAREDAFSRSELNERMRKKFPYDYFDGMVVRTPILNRLVDDGYLVKIESGGHGIFVYDSEAGDEELQIVSPTPSDMKDIVQQVFKRKGTRSDVDDIDIDWSSPSEVTRKVNEIVGEHVLMIRGAPNRYRLRKDIRNEIIHNSEWLDKLTQVRPEIVHIQEEDELGISDYNW